MAGEKTEAPTPRRREEARKKGNIPRSMELNSVMGLLAGAIAMKYFGENIITQMFDLMGQNLQAINRSDWNAAAVPYYGITLAISFFRITAPIMVALTAIGIATSFAQTGVVLTGKPMEPDFSRINPLKGFQRIFSKRSLVEFTKSLAKLSIVGYIAYQSFAARYLQVISLSGTDIRGAAGLVNDAMFEILIRAGFALLALAALDYGYQRWEYERSIRMSRQEVKDEVKQSEGDPQIRAKIRQQQRAMASRRMMHSVPSADVVVTNPTHFAVAIQYRPESMSSPKVTAKGQGLIAERIKQVARENNVPVMENKPLAQALYKTVEIGQEIPPGLYHAVAEVLAFIYSLRRNRRPS